MHKVAAQLHYFLRKYNIDPDKVKLILRADNDYVATEIEHGVKLELDPITQADTRKFELNGISISITTLDRSR